MCNANGFTLVKDTVDPFRHYNAAQARRLSESNQATLDRASNRNADITAAATPPLETTEDQIRKRLTVSQGLRPLGTA